MDIELVSKDSPRWIGFLHFLKSVVFSFLFAIIVTLLSLVIGLSTGVFLVGFYFSSFQQDVVLFFLSTLLGTWLSARITDTRNQDKKKILKASMYWAVALQMLIWIRLWGEQVPHYGETGREQLYEQIPLSIMILIEFYIISKIFLKDKLGDGDAEKGGGKMEAEEKNIADIELKWSVSPEESQGKEKAVLFMAIPLIIYGFFVSVFNSDINLDLKGLGIILGSFIVIAIISFSVIWFSIHFRKNKVREYKMNAEGMRIAYGEDSAFFRWEEFSSFFSDANMGGSTERSYVGLRNREFARKADAYLEEVKDVSGANFYLKLKPKSIIEKVFRYGNLVFVHGKPENYGAIYEMLSGRLEENESKYPGFGRILYK